VPRQKDAICDFYDAQAREPVASARNGVCKILPPGDGKERQARSASPGGGERSREEGRGGAAVPLNFTRVKLPPQNPLARVAGRAEGRTRSPIRETAAPSPAAGRGWPPNFYDPAGREPIACARPATLSISRRLSATGVNSVRELIILDARRSDVYV
jgi:hypothetical protein